MLMTDKEKEVVRAVMTMYLLMRQRHYRQWEQKDFMKQLKR